MQVALSLEPRRWAPLGTHSHPRCLPHPPRQSAAGTEREDVAGAPSPETWPNHPKIARNVPQSAEVAPTWPKSRQNWQSSPEIGRKFAPDSADFTPQVGGDRRSVGQPLARKWSNLCLQGMLEIAPKGPWCLPQRARQSIPRRPRRRRHRRPTGGAVHVAVVAGGAHAAGAGRIRQWRG